jgi:hypothetical protein
MDVSSKREIAIDIETWANVDRVIEIRVPFHSLSLGEEIEIRCGRRGTVSECCHVEGGIVCRAVRACTRQ